MISRRFVSLCRHVACTCRRFGALSSGTAITEKQQLQTYKPVVTRDELIRLSDEALIKARDKAVPRVERWAGREADKLVKECIREAKTGRKLYTAMLRSPVTFDVLPRWEVEQTLSKHMKQRFPDVDCKYITRREIAYAVDSTMDEEDEDRTIDSNEAVIDDEEDLVVEDLMDPGTILLRITWDAATDTAGAAAVPIKQQAAQQLNGV